MDGLNDQGGQRDWGRWQELRRDLDKAYKDEEAYWCQKTRIQWLQERDKILSFFTLVRFKEENPIG